MRMKGAKRTEQRRGRHEVWKAGLNMPGLTCKIVSELVHKQNQQQRDGELQTCQNPRIAVNQISVSVQNEAGFQRLVAVKRPRKRTAKGCCRR